MNPSDAEAGRAAPDPEPRRDLDSALAGLEYRVEPGRFALLGFPEPPEAADLAAIGAVPGQIVREAGETSVLARAELLPELIGRHPRARVERDLCWIRFEAAMGWEVVGFLAAVTGRLASAGVPLGAVCGYSRDHLFVAAPHLDRARAALAGIAVELGSEPG